MRSTQELNEERHADKLAQLEAKRRKAIEDGLQKLESLDADRISEELPREAYVRHAHEDLRRIMKKAQLTAAEE